MLGERFACHRLHEHGAIGWRDQELSFANFDSICRSFDLEVTGFDELKVSKLDG